MKRKCKFRRNTYNVLFYTKDSKTIEITPDTIPQYEKEILTNCPELSDRVYYLKSVRNRKKEIAEIIELTGRPWKQVVWELNRIDEREYWKHWRENRRARNNGGQ